MLKIFTEQLQDGQQETIDLVLPPEFLDLEEKEVRAISPVTVKGKAHRLDNLLLLTLTASTEIEMPCSICNQTTRVSLQNSNISITIDLSELPSSVFDYADLLREEMIILIPLFAECQKGACPERKELQSYLNKDPRYFPFKNL